MDWLTQPVPWLFVITAVVGIGWMILKAIDRLTDEVEKLRSEIRGLKARSSGGAP